MRTSPRAFLALLKEAAVAWSDDNAMRLSAALAYYSIFSLAPLLVIAVSLAGLIFGPAAARGQVAAQIAQLAGPRTADAIEALLKGASHKTSNVAATLIGIAVLLFGASSAFTELKSALNTIWGVAIKPGRPITTLIRARFISFSMVVGVGFLLLISLLLSAAVTALDTYMTNLLPVPGAMLQAADFVLSFIVVAVLFAMIFKMLPNVQLLWQDVWLGACVTALLFTIGKFLIGFYLGTTGVASAYGAAGSAIVILLWVYYSACILFYGAEFTKACVRRFRSGILPDRHADILIVPVRGEVPTRVP